MLTFQDFEKAKNNGNLLQFVETAISEHKTTEMYKMAVIAEDYNRHRNTTISNYQKLLYTVSGRAIPDNWSANYKMACRHFHRFVTQENQYLLGNGVIWENEETADKLGTARVKFDNQLQKLGKYALVDGVSFGFFNLNHLDVFRLTEFVPLVDEETGVLRAGIRFYQIDNNKPLTITIYEEDGYAEYLKNVQTTKADGENVTGGENYSAFPIVPLWANSEKQSTIIGLREQIDCYDLIKSGFADTVDDASFIYWTLTNAGGMTEIDMAQFLERMKTIHAHAFDDQVDAQAHTLDAPFASREALLDRLDKDLYRDAMALDVDRLASSNATATEIRASYEPLNAKTDDYEYQVLEFIYQILAIAGIEDNPTFTRSTIINTSEEIDKVVQSASFLPNDYVTKKILTLLGDGDQFESVFKQLQADEIDRFRAEEGEQ